jgi:hypothetical protein
MNSLESLGVDPVTAGEGACVLVALIAVWVIIRVRRRRRRVPTVAAFRWNPLPPGDSAIEEIRREIDENQKRSEAARLQEAREREAKDKRHRLERQWQRDGEIELDKKKT